MLLDRSSCKMAGMGYLTIIWLRYVHLRLFHVYMYTLLCCKNLYSLSFACLMAKSRIFILITPKNIDIIVANYRSEKKLVQFPGITERELTSDALWSVVAFVLLWVRICLLSDLKATSEAAAFLKVFLFLFFSTTPTSSKHFFSIKGSSICLRFLRLSIGGRGGEGSEEVELFSGSDLVFWTGGKLCFL